MSLGHSCNLGIITKYVCGFCSARAVRSTQCNRSLVNPRDLSTAGTSSLAPASANGDKAFQPVITMNSLYMRTGSNRCPVYLTVAGKKIHNSY